MTAAQTKPKRATRPDDCSDLQILPAATVHFAGGQSWAQTVVAAGKDTGRQRVVFATANLMRPPTFCGGLIIGAVRCDETALTAHATHLALPEIAPVPDNIRSKFNAHYEFRNSSHIWPIISVWHYLLTCSHFYWGAGMFIIFDRSAGPTLRRSLPALRVLHNRRMYGYYTGSSGNIGTRMTSLNPMKEYVNFNSAAKVRGVSLYLERTGSRPTGAVVQQELVHVDQDPLSEYGLSHPVVIPSPPYPG